MIVRKKSLLLLILLIVSMGPRAAVAGVYDDILVAARDNRTDIVVDLVRRGMDPNTSDRSGTTLLMFAVANGNEELLEFLLRNKANILKKNKYGDTAVGLAVLRGHLQIVRRLVAVGADIATPGWNALHYAAFGGHAEIVHFLVSKGAPLDAPAPNRQTSLMLAAKNGHIDAVKALVNAGATTTLVDMDGNTALGIALKAGNSRIADYLRGEGAGK